MIRHVMMFSGALCGLCALLIAGAIAHGIQLARPTIVIASIEQMDDINYVLTDGRFYISVRRPLPDVARPYRISLAPDAGHALVIERLPTGERYHRFDLLTQSLTTIPAVYDSTSLRPPVWSPDGRQAILYAPLDMTANYPKGLVRIDLELREVHHIELSDPHPLSTTQVAWSPDSQWFAWSHEGLYLSHVHGEPELILEDRVTWGSSVWSPDSSQLAISAKQTATEPDQLLIYTLSNRAWHVELSDWDEEYDTRIVPVSWSPDQHWFTYFKQYPQGIHVGFRSTSQFVPTNYPELYFNYLSWSTHHDRVALSLNATSPGAIAHMHVIDLANGGLTTVYNVGESWWSPDGEALLYTTSAGIEVLRLADLQRHLLPPALEGSIAAWLDAERIGYITDTGRFEILDADTLEPQFSTPVLRNLFFGAAKYIFLPG